MSNDTWGNDLDLMAPNASAFKFENYGDTCKGRIIKAEAKQQTDPEGNLKFWGNGDKMMQLVVIVEQDDATETALFFKGGNYEVADGKGKGSLEALKAAAPGVKQRELVGGQIAVQYSGTGKKTNPAFSAPKLYTVQYKAPAISLASDEDLF